LSSTKFTKSEVCGKAPKAHRYPSDRCFLNKHPNEQRTFED
jgi:hypothetical protein